MAESTSKRSEWLAWFWVLLWTLGIYLAIPLARTVEGFVRDNLGQAAFGWFVIAASLLATALAMRAQHVRSRAAGHISRAGLVWLIAVGAAFVAATISLWKNPEEAMHFVQYGALGVLLHRALGHRLRDASVYVVAALVGTFIGSVDEAIQWLTPGRYFGLRDIAINGVASVLVQVAIAKGFPPRPDRVSRGLGSAGIRSACRVAAALLALLLLFALNTPERTARWATAIPGFEFLAHNESTMMEYGYRYEDPEVGLFRSRLAPDALAEADARRGPGLAPAIAECLVDYGEFMRSMPPSRDAFLHELCVHLFRRDRYRFFVGRAPADDPVELRKLKTVVVREERLMQRYFGASLEASGKAIPADEFASLEAAEFADLDYESTVSQDLVTEWREWQLLAAFGVGFAALWGADRRARR